MLAHRTKLISVVTIAFVAMGTFVFGQQPQQPSRKYAPVPPTVHVPPQNTQRMQQMHTRDAMRAQTAQHQQFSDPMVRQTSYATQEGAPNVPEILTGSSQPPVAKQPPAAPQNQFAPKASDVFRTQPYQPKNVESEMTDGKPSATEMVQKIQQTTPRVDPEAISFQQNHFKEQLERIRQRTARKAQAATQAKPDPTPEAEQVQYTQEQLKDMDESFIDEILSATEPTTSPVQHAAPTQEVQPMPSTSQTTMAPKLTAKPVQRVATNDMHMNPTFNKMRQNPVQQTTATEPVSNSMAQPEITLAAPGVEVQTFGPKTIGINKTSTYRITVANNGRTDAEQILIGINLPQWVDISNTNMTNGDKEITDGINQARLVWTVDRVPAGSNQTITIDAVPRKAERFDLGVEWTYAPRVGTTQVQVTEPRLEMKIAGPRDVLYGEKAIYHVTVRNPGTGMAENVNVMLPEALGGERATLGEIPAGREKNFQVELLARTAGQLEMTATATADGNLSTASTRQIEVRRANIGVIISGPPMKYAGSVGQYMITVNNTGDATAQEVVAAVALPVGVKYLSGVDGSTEIEGGVRWNVGSLDPGEERAYKINCELNANGDLQVECGARGQGDLAASSACVTTVETVADLVLAVADPKGPLPTGEDVIYEIHVNNRGTRAARNVQLVMQFSEGIEPIAAQGLKHKLVPGQVLFSPIAQINPGEKLSFQVTAKAHKPDTHIFRAQLTCADSDAREIAEGTTRFFGEHVAPVKTPVQTPDTTEVELNTADANNEFAPAGESVNR